MKRVKKLISYITIMVAAAAMLGGLTSCQDGKSYSDLLRDEDHYVNWYLAQQNVEVVIPENSEFITGADAPYYKMDKDGNVYMRVISKGDMEDRPEKGDRVYFRFMRTSIKYLYQGGSDVSAGNADDMSSALGGLSLIYGNTQLTSTTQYGNGLQVPLEYLGYNCEVDLIVKSVEGFSNEISSCIPYVYKGLKYYKAEY